MPVNLSLTFDNFPRFPLSRASPAFADRCTTFQDDPRHKITDWAAGYLPSLEAMGLEGGGAGRGGIRLLDVGCGRGTLDRDGIALLLDAKSSLG